MSGKQFKYKNKVHCPLCPLVLAHFDSLRKHIRTCHSSYVEFVQKIEEKDISEKDAVSKVIKNIKNKQDLKIESFKKFISSQQPNIRSFYLEKSKPGPSNEVGTSNLIPQTQVLNNGTQRTVLSQSDTSEKKLISSSSTDQKTPGPSNEVGTSNLIPQSQVLNNSTQRTVLSQSDTSEKKLISSSSTDQNANDVLEPLEEIHFKSQPLKSSSSSQPSDLEDFLSRFKNCSNCSKILGSLHAHQNYINDFTCELHKENCCCQKLIKSITLDQDLPNKLDDMSGWKLCSC